MNYQIADIGVAFTFERRVNYDAHEPAISKLGYEIVKRFNEFPQLQAKYDLALETIASLTVVKP